MNEVGAEWDVNRRDTASHEIDGMNETRSGEMNDVWLASLRFPFHSSRLSWFGPVLFVHLPSPLPPVVTNGMRNRGESKEPSVTSGMSYHRT